MLTYSESLKLRPFKPQTFQYLKKINSKFFILNICLDNLRARVCDKVSLLFVKHVFACD